MQFDGISVFVFFKLGFLCVALEPVLELTLLELKLTETRPPPWTPDTH